MKVLTKIEVEECMCVCVFVRVRECVRKPFADGSDCGPGPPQ